MEMIVRNAEFEDMKQLGHIMAVSFRTAFSDFVTKQTLDACAQEDNCVAMLEGIYREGKMHFLIGENSGLLVWQKCRIPQKSLPFILCRKAGVQAWDMQCWRKL